MCETAGLSEEMLEEERSRMRNQHNKEMTDLRAKMEAVQGILEDVPYGVDGLKNVVGYQRYGRSVAPEAAMHALSVDLERCRRMLAMHEEIAALPIEDRELLVRMNSFKAVALCHARLESGASAWEWIMPRSELDAWPAIETCFDADDRTHEMRPYSLVAMNKESGYVGPAQSEAYVALSARLAPALSAVSDDSKDAVFPVLLLLALLSNGHKLEAEASRRAVAQLQRRYATTLKRAMCAAVGRDYGAVLDAHFKEVNACMKPLTKIVLHFYQSVNNRVAKAEEERSFSPY